MGIAIPTYNLQITDDFHILCIIKLMVILSSTQKPLNFDETTDSGSFYSNKILNCMICCYILGASWALIV